MTFGISAATLATVGATVGGAYIASQGAKDAASTQAGSARDATAAEREMFERQIQLQEPWRQAGGIGLNSLMYGLGLSPTGTFQPGSAGGTPLLTPGADGVFAPSTGALAQSPGGETAAQIRARLAPQFTTGTQAQLIGPAARRGGAFGQILGNAALQASGLQPSTVNTSGLDAAVAAEMARQQQAAAAGQQTATTNASTDPNYGSLMRDFSMADYQADPGLAFRQQQGEQGMQRAAAASGGLGSGKYLKDAMAFNSGLASQEYGNAYNRYQTNRGTKLNALQSLSGMGQSSANTLTQAAGNFGTQIGSNIIGAGNAAAAGQVGGANAINGAIGQGLSMYQNQNMLNQLLANRGGITGTGFGGGGMMDSLRGYGVF